MCNIYQNHVHSLILYGFSPMFLKEEKNKQTKNKQKQKLYKHKNLKKNKEKI